ncbi:MAG: type II toxin-antitoxin system Phd/YefM family antitoxin [Caldilineaceae bacterium]
MKIAPIAEIKAQFSAFVKASEEGPVIVTKNGKPVAVLLGISDEDEIERLTVAYSKKLRALLDAAEKRIQATGGIPHDALWQQVDAGYTDKPSPGQTGSDLILGKPQKKQRRRTNSGQ